MRITNKMMTNNALYNINTNKNLLDMLENRYSSGKKITRPSDDPIVAVRALKFRTNLTEIEQYTEKNIPDALNWMEVTEGSLDTINSIISSMNTYCNQGANDYLTAEDRNSIVINLQQYANQLYQEGNTNYAGRYVFSGYKTDTPLVFNEDTEDVKYSITEKNIGEDLEMVTVITGGVQIDDLNLTNDNYATEWDALYPTMPSTKSVYRLALGYDDLDDVIPEITYVDSAGTEHSTLNGTNFGARGLTVNAYSVSDKDAYNVADEEINFIKETGELILGKNVYEQMQKSTDISVTFEKTKFNQNDLRPEHYYDCTTKDLDTGKEVTYTKKDQDIRYEVNFNQKLTINTQGCDAFTTRIDRMVTEITDAVQAVADIEDQLTQVDKMLGDTRYSEDRIEKLKAIREQLESEYTLRTALMTDAFQRGITITAEEQENTNVCVADLGGRYKRLLLTQSRLEDQATDYEELLSENEDADLVDTIVKYQSAKTVYDSSLNATSQLVRSSLMDYIS
ncbi:MAG: flagellar hook-associated protein FlgL [Lachnospiraceae bacterium]|nr:flagellar hook-associated protein FlgL [Lachnospiraceae bacterium]